MLDKERLIERLDFLMGKLEERAERLEAEAVEPPKSINLLNPAEPYVNAARLQGQAEGLRMQLDVMRALKVHIELGEFDEFSE